MYKYFYVLGLIKSTSRKTSNFNFKRYQISRIEINVRLYVSG